MTDSIPPYARFFPKGQRVQLLLPTPEGTPFIEWAVVFTLLDDLLELRLSRDRLPTGISLGLGVTVELKIVRDGTVYACRVLVVGELDRELLSVRLVGDVIISDLREYFRIDAYLPVRYVIPDTTDTEALQEQWINRRDRIAASKDQSAIFFSDTFPSRDSGGTIQPWAQPHPIAANISGGGIKVNIPDPLPKDTYLFIELFLPLVPPHVVETVGKVIQSEKLLMPDDAAPIYQTAITFVFVDERDRDAIINYITTEQIRRLRAMQRTEPTVPPATPKRSTFRTVAKRCAAGLIIIILLVVLTRYFYHYNQGHEKSEIATIFEGGIKKYLEQLRQHPAP
ncbi:PilZ-like domain-containing protein [Geobacter argillaceus]|uniref:PilZ domain-containing protein n=1 Tax=Geobacter argillaceus TaxID=345631 RepID=A0A562VPM0_9BACT|nr:PilZ-like domain-containing protein [Geobacter argillaceus]TWJ19840.1 PilZ domain-containing protein [Geobacter argillaceus]